MKELLLGIASCLGMMGLLWGYLKVVKKKYYNDKWPSSLSNTFYHTGWKFRALLIALCLLLFYPILLACGSYVEGSWVYSAPTTLIAWAKFTYALCIGGIFGVALCADFRKKEQTPHVLSAGGLAAVGGALGSMLRPQWYIGLGVWVAWLVYYLIKQIKNKKAKNPDAFSLFMEEVAFYSVPTCLIIYMIMNYLG